MEFFNLINIQTKLIKGHLKFSSNSRFKTLFDSNTNVNLFSKP